MSRASLDRLLAVLVLAMAGTGLLTLRAGSPGTAPVFVAHGLLAGALLVAVVVKIGRSVPPALRRATGEPRSSATARLVLGLAVTLLAAAALSGGYLWVAGGSLLTLGGWTVLTLHAWFGLALVPLMVVHLLPRRWRLLRPSGNAVARARAGFGRRALLAGGLLGLAGVALFGAAAAVERLRGGERRFTGSRWLAGGEVPPATTFFGEPVPPAERLDPVTWRLRVRGRVAHPLELSLADLAALGVTELAAVLDCTSGWAIETAWSGVPVAAVLAAAEPDAAARDVDVRSVTGWGARLSLDEARACLLATAVAGAPLPAANGAPCRLVVPDRRGLDWVKWVAEVEVS